MADLQTACDALNVMLHDLVAFNITTEQEAAGIKRAARDVGMAVWTECCEEVTGDTEPLGAVWAELDRLLGETPDG